MKSKNQTAFSFYIYQVELRILFILIHSEGMCQKNSMYSYVVLK